MRLPFALLGLLLACDSAAPLPHAADVTRGSNPTRPAVDRGLIVSTPTVHASALPAELPEAPPTPEEAKPEILVVASTDALDTEVRARLPKHRLACARVKRLPCQATGDLDGDGAQDVVVLVEPADGRTLGLAILWGRGGVDLLGAGRRGQRWIVQNDDSSEREAIPADLSIMARWAVWSADGPKDARRGFIDPRKHRFGAPAVHGDGILIDDGDSATIAYHDGKSWRLQSLGF